jgi:DNA mismatch repair protein MutL
MSDIIHLLPDSIANQIAAGEVIQRPASVVKELVENSIDAGATSITVNIKDAGRTLVQVIDNGKGMSETDARMAFERHATSKITSADDLFSLNTMGFRGEALASIAAVAQVELRTRQTNSELGVRLSFSGSELNEIEPNACSPGSIFSVKNLFFNVPARRKFLKSNDVEFRNIVNEFERMALVNSNISMSLCHNDVDFFNLPEAGLRQRIIDVFGKILNQKLLTIDVESSLVNVSGFVGKPDFTKKRGALQYFFVNGRFMKHPYFHKAIMQAYENLIPLGESPSYFIYLNLDQSTIDVNIHPTKTEIKFENEQPIWQILMAATKEALAKSNAVPSIDFDVSEEAIEIPVYTQGNKGGHLFSPKVDVDTSYNPFRDTSKPKNNVAFDWTKLYENFEEDKIFAEKDVFESLASKDVVSENLPYSCYQYKNKYIVTTLKSGLVIIDQCRAHVRILFDQYLYMIQNKKGVSQHLLFPETLEFTPKEFLVVPSIIDELRFVGFDLKLSTGNSLIVNGVPSGFEKIDVSALIHDFVNKFMELECSVKEESSYIIALSLAKSAAIPTGKSLSVDEMDNLIASLFSCKESTIGPDGKTVLSVFVDDELAKLF